MVVIHLGVIKFPLASLNGLNEQLAISNGGVGKQVSEAPFAALANSDVALNKFAIKEIHIRKLRCSRRIHTWGQEEKMDSR